ncbi:increased loss of mitochondrial DNA protein 1 [Tirmania nivea]|nr:increased loss of mitochondrial DNA protein 1 [Tirmania nivea]
MASVSAFTLIRIVIGVHFIVSYLLLTSPGNIVTNGVVKMLGESTGFAPLSMKSLESSPAVTAFAGILLGLLGFVDFTALASSATGGDASRIHWEIQAPSRLIAFMGLTAYTYIFKPHRTTRFVPLTAEEEKLAGLKTGAVFTWAFFEMVWWFWIYIKLREEKRDAQLRLAQQAAEKEAMENNYM